MSNAAAYGDLELTQYLFGLSTHQYLNEVLLTTIIGTDYKKGVQSKMIATIQLILSDRDFPFDLQPVINRARELNLDQVVEYLQNALT